MEDPESVFKLLEKLSRVEGISPALKDIVFQFMVARLHSLSGDKIALHEIIPPSDGQATEVDVVARGRRGIVCVVCRAKARGELTDAPELRRWVNKELPRIREWLENTPSLPSKKRVEFCVSGGLTKRATAYVKKITGRSEKPPVAFLTGEQIVAKLRKEKQESLVQLFQKHFGGK